MIMTLKRNFRSMKEIIEEKQRRILASDEKESKITSKHKTFKNSSQSELDILVKSVKSKQALKSGGELSKKRKRKKL